MSNSFVTLTLRDIYYKYILYNIHISAPVYWQDNIMFVCLSPLKLYEWMNSGLYYMATLLFSSLLSLSLAFSFCSRYSIENSKTGLSALNAVSRRMHFYFFSQNNSDTFCTIYILNLSILLKKVKIKDMKYKKYMKQHVKNT